MKGKADRKKEPEVAIKHLGGRGIQGEKVSTVICSRKASRIGPKIKKLSGEKARKRPTNLE